MTDQTPDASAAKAFLVGDPEAEALANARERAQRAEAEVGALRHSHTLRTIANEYKIRPDDMEFIDDPDPDEIKRKAAHWVTRMPHRLIGNEPRPIVGFAIDSYRNDPDNRPTPEMRRRETANKLFGSLW